MKFNTDLLNAYKRLLQTTNLKEGYQEFVALFRYLRIELEKQLPAYQFQGKIVENGMDYSYFQFADEKLKQQGLKIVVVFVHRDFQFEVWLSRVNRKVQCQYHHLWQQSPIAFELASNPSRQDYIFRVPLSEELDLSDGDGVVLEIKKTVLDVVSFLHQDGII